MFPANSKKITRSRHSPWRGPSWPVFHRSVICQRFCNHKLIHLAGDCLPGFTRALLVGIRDHSFLMDRVEPVVFGEGPTKNVRAKRWSYPKNQTVVLKDRVQNVVECWYFVKARVHLYPLKRDQLLVIQLSYGIFLNLIILLETFGGG